MHCSHPKWHVHGSEAAEVDQIKNKRDRAGSATQGRVLHSCGRQNLNCAGCCPANSTLLRLWLACSTCWWSTGFAYPRTLDITEYRRAQLRIANQSRRDLHFVLGSACRARPSVVQTASPGDRSCAKVGLSRAAWQCRFTNNKRSDQC